MDMIEKKTWQEFRDSKLLWWVNRTLHLFGWAIVYDVDPEDYNKVMDVYPARVKFRGFAEHSESTGFTGLTQYLKNNIDDLEKEIQ